VVSWNPAAERLLGWRGEEVRGRSLLELTVPAQLRGQAQQLLERVRRGDVVPPFDTVRLDRHGVPVDVALSAVPIRDERGQVSGVATSMHDIRPRRAAQARILELNATLEQQVRERTAELRAVVENAASAIITADRACRITGMNPAGEAMLGMRARDALGRCVLELHDQDDLRQRSHLMPREVHDAVHEFPPHIRQLLYQGGPLPPAREHGQSEWLYRRADGTCFPGLLNLSLLRDAAGHSHGFLGIVTDLTERKALEEQLRERTRQAEGASRAKSAFLANMSHEIRTPLNAVIGMSHLLKQTGLDERQRVLVTHVNSADEHLLSILNDILDLSKIEAGKLQLEEHDFELRTLLQRVGSIVGDSALSKGLTVAVDAGTVPDMLRGDETRLRQALLNYASNAVTSRCARERCRSKGRGCWCASRSRTPAWASRRSRWHDSSRPSSRPMSPPPASTAARDLGWPSRAAWPSSWAATPARSPGRVEAASSGSRPGWVVGPPWPRLLPPHLRAPAPNCAGATPARGCWWQKTTKSTARWRWRCCVAWDWRWTLPRMAASRSRKRSKRPTTWC
jgi:PAS domain S-box-containing protein